MDQPNDSTPDDLAQLNALGIAYYVLAGISFPFSCFFGVWLWVGMGAADGLVSDGAALLAIALPLFTTIAVPALAFWTGRKLRRRESRSFCLVGAAISCFTFPIGTVVGVLTMVVLNRRSVRAVFEEKENAKNNRDDDDGNRMAYPSRTVSER